MIKFLGKRSIIIIVLLATLFALSEVTLTLVISNLLSFLFTPSAALELAVDVKWVGYLILIYFLVFVINYAVVNQLIFSKLVAYSNERIIDLISHRYDIDIKREEFVNIYVGEMFRVIDKILINLVNFFTKFIATLFLLLIGIYLAGTQFAITLGVFLLVFALLGLSTQSLSKKVSLGIGEANEERISLLTSLYENRLIFMLTRSENALKNLLEKNRSRIVKIRVLSNLLSGLPRALVDVVLFASVLALYYVVQSGFIESTSVVFAGVITLRLVPILNQMYHGFSEYRNNKSSLGLLIADYRVNLNYVWHDLCHESILFEWKDIDVVYPNKKVALPDLSLKKGEHLLLRGPSGSGKSTFVKLILGQVSNVNGYLAKTQNDIDISLCEQNALLFPGSILFNITFCDTIETVNIRRLQEVCQTVAVYDFIDGVQGLIDSNIDSTGSNFSGGQKQRIALARALYKEADLYIFDEATSALNAELQKRIYKNILDFITDRTSIHVSHQEEMFKLFPNQIEL